MSKKDEISAIDAIYEILEKVETIETFAKVTDNNIKLLNNKVAKLTKKIDELETAPAKKAGLVTAVVPQSNKTKNIKVFGNIRNSKKEPISDVSINIYDENGTEVKSTKTNPTGYWSVILTSGKYGVEYIHQKFKPINKVIEITNDMATYEVK